MRLAEVTSDSINTSAPSQLRTLDFELLTAAQSLYEVSIQYPEYKKETKEFFEMALRDEAPSVKARIRNYER